jgi:hypothetical protein
MEKTQNTTVQVMVTLEGGLVRDLQVFQSKTGAQQFWDASINEAKKHVEYQKLSLEEQQDFDMDPFGFAYDGDIELVWEEATVRD